jgi:acyl carrier protein
MAAQIEVPVGQLMDQASLAEDLDLDSFERLTLHMAVEIDFQVEFELDVGVVTTVGDFIDAVEAAQEQASNTVVSFRDVAAPDA